MVLEVKQWPESQSVMEDSEWFFISGDGIDDPIGSAAMARIIKEELDNDNTIYKKLETS